MKQRVITGVIMAVVFIPLFLVGGWLLNGLLVLFAAGGTYELFRLYNEGDHLPKWLGGLYILLSMILYGFIVMYYTGDYSLEWVFLLMILLLVVGATLLVFISAYKSNDVGEMLFSILYPAVGFGAIFALRDFDLYTLGFLFLITVSTDIFAYIVGVNFGKHRLAINISPKKSIEGSIGGTVAAVILTTIYVYAIGMESVGEIPLNIAIVIALIIGISVIGQIGDLVASKLKRDKGIKDFSQLFPGHGGVLDRFDSVLFAGMVLMLLSTLVGTL